MTDLDIKQLQARVQGLQKECDDVYAEQKAAHRRAGVAEHHCISWMWEYTACKKRYATLLNTAISHHTVCAPPGECALCDLIHYDGGEEI